MAEITHAAGLGRSQKCARCVNIDAVHLRYISQFRREMDDRVTPRNQFIKIQAFEKVHLPPIDALRFARLPVVLPSHLKAEPLQRGHHKAPAMPEAPVTRTVELIGRLSAPPSS